MRKKNLTLSSILFSLLIIAYACNKENTEPVGGEEIKVSFEFVYDGEPLDIDGKRYINKAGEEFTIERFHFYLSNIKLIGEQESYVEKDSYHLIGTASKKGFTLKNIPPEKYETLTMSIGVDSKANASIDNPGDLDPNNNMAWDWNTGYKFISLSGRYFPADHNQRGLVIHIGTDPYYRTFDFDLSEIHGGEALKSSEAKELVFTVEIKEMFENPNTISFAEKTSWMFDKEVVKMVDNYTNGFLRLKEIKK
jgi:hypothetical protein